MEQDFWTSQRKLCKDRGYHSGIAFSRYHTGRICSFYLDCRRNLGERVVLHIFQTKCHINSSTQQGNLCEGSLARFCLRYECRHESWKFFRCRPKSSARTDKCTFLHSWFCVRRAIKLHVEKCREDIDEQFPRRGRSKARRGPQTRDIQSTCPAQENEDISRCVSADTPTSATI